MKRRLRIGIFGGSFDPPHTGHLSLASAAVRELSLDKLYFVPALDPPHAKLKRLTDASLRLAMVRAAVKGRPRLAVDDFELRSRPPSYTYRSILYFRKKFPRAALFFILGSDSLAEVLSWKHGRRLTDMCVFAVARRPSTSKKIPPGPAKKAFFLKSAMPDVSSTRLRAARGRGHGLPSAVARIIRKNNLYVFEAAEEYLKKNLDSAKWRHTMGVVSLARRLALKHGANTRRAALAALLHDMGRSEPASRYLRLVGPVPGVRLPATATVRANPFLLHSYVSARLAGRVFGVRDREVLAAAANHTLGAPAASATVYDDIIYVADACAPDRRFPGVSRIRRLAMRDLKAGVFAAAAMKLSYVIKKKKYIAPEGIAVYNSRLNRLHDEK